MSDFIAVSEYYYFDVLYILYLNGHLISSTLLSYFLKTMICLEKERPTEPGTYKLTFLNLWGHVKVQREICFTAVWEAMLFYLLHLTNLYHCWNGGPFERPVVPTQDSISDITLLCFFLPCQRSPLYHATEPHRHILTGVSGDKMVSIYCRFRELEASSLIWNLQKHRCWQKMAV